VPGRFCLAIEISNPSSGPRGRIMRAGPHPIDAGPGVALAHMDDAGNLEYLSTELLSDKGRHDDDLMPAIDRLCARHGARSRDLARLAVSIGPGGYTSIRIAIATAKMLSEVTAARIAAIPSWRVAARFRPAEATLVCLASKDDSAWAALVPGPGPLGLITAAEVLELKPAAIIADRFLPPPMREAALRIGAEVSEPIFAAASLLELAGPGAETVDATALTPLYPREAEAVSQWRRLHPPG
jgi:tRNA A37 threonylcarbamoyladenosine modification protein TsaB